VGLSIEYPALTAYTGTDPTAIDPVFEQLVRNLNPGQSPVLRIGGDSADTTWWPVASMTKPPGVSFELTPQWLAVTSALATDLDARMILGINLEADSEPLVAAEGKALMEAVGRMHTAALEIGNEPELYGSFTYYKLPDGITRVAGRPANWSFSDYIDDFNRMAAQLPGRPIAGPTIGIAGWMRHLQSFLARAPKLQDVTLHRYPLQACFTARASRQYPTIAHLLAPFASAGLANSVARYVALAHQHHVPLRIDELNSVSCGGARRVSDVFASSLWALDTLFGMARVGVDGVNIHTFPGSPYQLFWVKNENGVWSAFVEPEYYGLLMFTQAAPPGSHLLNVSAKRKTPLKVWATRARDGTVHVVLINETHRIQTIALTAPVSANDHATLKLLQAPSVRSHTGVSIGGQSFGAQTLNGQLAGKQSLQTLTPVEGQYLVKVPPTSAAMLTFAPPAPATQK
jgi:hypothetical protein